MSDWFELNKGVDGQYSFDLEDDGESLVAIIGYRHCL